MENGEFRTKYVPFTLATTLTTAVIFTIVSACTDHQAKAKPNFVHKEAPKAGVVAKINGEEITEDTLIGDDKLDFIDIKNKEYDLKMDRLQKLITERLVGAEAKKENMSYEDYLSKKVVKGEIKISDKEYKKFITDRHFPESRIRPEDKEKIIGYMQTMKKTDLVQDYVAKLTKKNAVEVYFSKPTQLSIDIGEAPTMGKKDAAVKIVAFSDFQCPYCKMGAERIDEIKKKYGGKVQFVFKQFPLPMHKDARPAAEASLCVNEQGMEKFWKFHDIIFKNQEKMDLDSLSKYATQAGANEKKYKECMDGKKFTQVVQKDMEYGEKLGIKSTPTFFVNGQLVSGAVPIEKFSEIIDEELESKKN